MGYYVKIVSGVVTIPKETQERVLNRWKMINGPEFDHIKRGGSFSGGSKHESWYSWMDKDYHLTVKSCEEVLDMLGFDFTVEDNGDISVTGYDNKTGQEDKFFAAIHKWVHGGFTWMGEDEECYYWTFPIEQYDPSSGIETLAWEQLALTNSEG